ncbi:MAG: OmpH family outer membrane protein [Rhodobacteraceae bacterium]|nr:OmpH family outer membrane protein [Paracoccaceae bacterium]
MRAAGGMVGLLVAVALTPVAAQEPAPMVPAQNLQASFATLDRERFFAGSLMGQAAEQRYEAASAELLAENRQLEASLEEEERQLTLRRATMPADQFRALAQEFDTRVEELRAAQDSKSRSLTRRREEDQQAFFKASIPVLAGLMEDLGAVAIIDRSAVILSFDRVDITAQAIARLDAVLGDGTTPAPPPEPLPEPAP